MVSNYIGFTLRVNPWLWNWAQVCKFVIAVPLGQPVERRFLWSLRFQVWISSEQTSTYQVLIKKSLSNSYSSVQSFSYNITSLLIYWHVQTQSKGIACFSFIYNNQYYSLHFSQSLFILFLNLHSGIWWYF